MYRFAPWIEHPKDYSAVFASQKSSGTLHFRFAHPHLTAIKRKARCTSLSQISALLKLLLIAMLNEMIFSGSKVEGGQFKNKKRRG